MFIRDEHQCKEKGGSSIEGGAELQHRPHKALADQAGSLEASTTQSVLG